jgi:anti-sigma-K factor RskA
MTCEERRDQFLLYAAGGAEGDEREALLAHLEAGCPKCAGYLAEASTVLAHLPLALEPVAPPPQLRERLLRRARAVGTPRTAPSGLRALAARWVPPVAAAALVAGALLLGVIRPMRDERRKLEGDLARERGEIERLHGELSAAMNTVRMLHSPRLELAVLAGAEPQPGAWGRVLRDEANRVWQLYTFGLKSMPSDKIYELWLITADERKVPAGTFNVDRSGVGSLRVEVPEGLGDIVVVAVTDEPAGGVAQPTGSIQLVAKL